MQGFEIASFFEGRYKVEKIMKLVNGAPVFSKQARRKVENVSDDDATQQTGRTNV